MSWLSSSEFTAWKYPGVLLNHAPLSGLSMQLYGAHKEVNVKENAMEDFIPGKKWWERVNREESTVSRYLFRTRKSEKTIPKELEKWKWRQNFGRATKKSVVRKRILEMGVPIGKDKGKGNWAMKDKSRKSKRKKLMLRHEVYETFHSQNTVV